jgi:general secretion pathway protein G
MKRSEPLKITGRDGFTLIELMVVMAIIAILVGITLGVASAVNQGNVEAQAKAELAALQQEIELFKSDTGSYPPNQFVRGTYTLGVDFYRWFEDKYGNGNGSFDADDRIYDTTDTIDGSGASTGRNPVSVFLYPADPWGRPYVYLFDATNPYVFSVGCLGADGLWGDGNPNNVNNFGAGDDISSRKGL